MGPDGPTWDERLEDVLITQFVRRHRAVLAGVTAAATVAMAAAFYLSTRPPPDDGVVHVSIEPVATGVGDAPAVVSEDGVMILGYRLTPDRGTDTVRALGLVGPAVRASSVELRTATLPGRAVLADVSVVPGCDDPRSATATLAAYGPVPSGSRACSSSSRWRST